MGRPRIILVDRDALLAAILAVELAKVRDLKRKLSRLSPEAKRLSDCRGRFGFCTYEQELQKRLKEAPWVKYDLPALVGRKLTDSELVVHRKALREMEADGLLYLDPPRKPNAIKLTKQGRDRAEELLAHAKRKGGKR